MPERILVAVITGGRPKLSDRITAKYLPALRDAGYDVIWVTREDQAVEYELDEFPIETFTVAWANQYARTHWRHPVAKFIPGGFHGAFTGREWAMRLGADREYDAVIQLDDNILHIAPLQPGRPLSTITAPTMFSLLVDLVFSTNVVMCGMQLSSFNVRNSPRLIRPGYPYSAFVERIASTRLPYYGPFEDDIMHSLDYALGAAKTTTGIVEVFKYQKMSGGLTGMRSQYDTTRGLEIARRYPKNVRLEIGSRTSSVQGTHERGFRHFLNTRGFNPIHITDQIRYDIAAKSIEKIVDDCLKQSAISSREKMAARSKTSSSVSSESGL